MDTGDARFHHKNIRKAIALRAREFLQVRIDRLHFLEGNAHADWNGLRFIAAAFVIEFSIMSNISLLPRRLQIEVLTHVSQIERYIATDTSLAAEYLPN